MGAAEINVSALPAGDTLSRYVAIAGSSADGGRGRRLLAARDFDAGE